MDGFSARTHPPAWNHRDIHYLALRDRDGVVTASGYMDLGFLDRRYRG